MQFMASDLADIEQIEEQRQKEAATGRRLMEATNQLNLALDDYRGRHSELRILVLFSNQNHKNIQGLKASLCDHNFWKWCL